jgi:hypothetical protein
VDYPVSPVVEILLDKIGALPINSIYELLGFLVAWLATA